MMVAALMSVLLASDTGTIALRKAFQLVGCTTNKLIVCEARTQNSADIVTYSQVGERKVVGLINSGEKAIGISTSGQIIVDRASRFRMIGSQHLHPPIDLSHGLVGVFGPLVVSYSAPRYLHVSSASGKVWSWELPPGQLSSVSATPSFKRLFVVIKDGRSFHSHLLTLAEDGSVKELNGSRQELGYLPIEGAVSLDEHRLAYFKSDSVRERTSDGTIVADAEPPESYEYTLAVRDFSTKKTVVVGSYRIDSSLLAWESGRDLICKGFKPKQIAILVSPKKVTIVQVRL